VDYEDLIPESRTAQLDDHDVLRAPRLKGFSYFPPGASIVQHSGYVLLGLIVARVSGMCVPEFLRARIFVPLRDGRDGAHVEGSDTIPRRAYGYSPPAGICTDGPEPSQPRQLGTAGFTRSGRHDAMDQARTGGAPSSSMRQPWSWLRRPANAAGAATQYGFGWFIDQFRARRAGAIRRTSGFRNAIQRSRDAT